VKLGVDFGTNRIVVATADRGNYPLVSFEAPDGASPDWFPSLIAIRGDERLYGWDAYDRQSDEAWTVIRSIKRLLEDAGPQTFLDLGDQKLKLTGLLDGLTSSLLTTLQQRSNLRIPPGEALEIVLGVPAHANSNQRFLSVRLAQQRYVKSHRNLLRSPHSGPHPGTPYRPIRVTGVGRPLDSFCFRGLKSAESVRR